MTSGSQKTAVADGRKIGKGREIERVNRSDVGSGLSELGTDGLTYGVGEDGPECRGRQDQRARRPIFDGEHHQPADDAPDGDGGQRVGDTAEPPAWTAVILGQRTHAAGTGGHTPLCRGWA